MKENFMIIPPIFLPIFLYI